MLMLKSWPKVLARRLENILPSVICEDQTGFVKNRHSYFNICWLFDILYLPSGATPECVLSLLIRDFGKFGFGTNFITWIKLLYSSPTASVLTNSQLSQPFNLYHPRQGCPLRPQLFDLAMEPLAKAIHSCETISGIWRNGVEHKVALYADDLLSHVQIPLYLLCWLCSTVLASSRDRN